MESSSKRRLTADELPHLIENFPLAQNWEMILLNPGPIFSIGVMLLVAGSQITPSVIQEVQTYVYEQ